MSAEESKAIVRQFWGVWGEGNIGLAEELLAPDYVNHSPGIPDQPEGPEGLGRLSPCSGAVCPISG